MERNRISYRLPKEHGPRVVVIGGGHGLSTMLRGLKHYTENLSAVVTVADDGGGSACCARILVCPRREISATVWRHWPTRSLS